MVNKGNVALNVVVALGLVVVIVLNSVKGTRLLGKTKSNVYVVLAASLLLCNLLCMKMKHPMLKGLCVVVSLVLVNLATNDYHILPTTGSTDVDEGMKNANRVVTLVVAALQAVMCVSACCTK